MYKIYRSPSHNIPRPFIHGPFKLLALKILIYCKAYKMIFNENCRWTKCYYDVFFNIYLFICSSIQIYSLGSIDVCHRKHILKFVEIVTTKITPATYCYEKMCFFSCWHYGMLIDPLTMTFYSLLWWKTRKIHAHRY